MAIILWAKTPDSNRYVKFQNSEAMRKAILILGIILFNMSLFSCTTSDLAEEIGIEEVATEGEEAEVNEVPDED
ncbi:hypothetical protein J8281_06775 [Aquimarina sp. U1-2]|uniref:hypothetical protein n=1 Tax=Aquimarina sp. U1-2 TaxID=2823141 RepID=UPI001AECCC5B|nr:hypothetical protein [Aquimarina sp. U1-2]MBP2831888.1 hypothetical protein [Aquimarina sp. U1-2]